MLRLDVWPANRAHFGELWAFCEDVLEVCGALGVDPVMNASLAVLVYAKDPTLEVHDVDLSCPEAHFGSLAAACEDAGMRAEVMQWHVLELHRGELKVEFDGAEHWMQGLTGRTERFEHGRGALEVVCREDLATLYERGVAAYEGVTEPAALARRADLRRKLDLVRA